MTTRARTDLAALPADELVARLHPYDERTGEHTAAAAAQIAELVRYLNVATLDDPAAAVPGPNTAASVLGALHTACQRLPQLLDQLGSRMQTLAADPNLATGSSTDTAQILAERTVTFLDAAGPALDQLTAAVGKAWQAADRLYLDVDDEDL